MKLISIADHFFTLCSFDNELLKNTNCRPYLLAVKLIYKGKKQDFAIPFRSNIAKSVDKKECFKLPPRFTTQSGRIHGLHYTKMFPILRIYLQQYTVNQSYDALIATIIKKHTRQIVKEAQSYLTDYENGIRYPFATNIDYILATLSGLVSMSEVAVTSSMSADREKEIHHDE